MKKSMIAVVLFGLVLLVSAQSCTQDEANNEQELYSPGHDDEPCPECG